MAGSDMHKALEATLTVLQDSAHELAFSDVVRCVIEKTHVDEATAKAAILRLSSDGQVEITPDWSVRLTRVELEAVAA